MAGCTGVSSIVTEKTGRENFGLRWCVVRICERQVDLVLQE
jgi:hypothetical protein